MNAAPPKPATAPTVAQEFDGGATDIPDVSIVDFPVLTDAIDSGEPRAAAPLAPPSTPTPARTVAAATAPPASPAAKPTPAPAVTAAPPRVETAYSGSRTAPSAKTTTPAAQAPPPPPAPVKPAAAAPAPAPTPAKPAAASAPPKAAPPAPEPQEEDDALRQTQTMRAISEAKSIVDISDSMAETLFGDAELDFLSTSLAAGAGGWQESDAALAPAKPAPAKAPAAAAQPKSAKAAASENDDLLDLLGLADAPLELIDDSAEPPADPARKSGAQR